MTKAIKGNEEKHKCANEKACIVELHENDWNEKKRQKMDDYLNGWEHLDCSLLDIYNEKVD